jgi:ABC-2 type transport system permease protein
MKWRRLKAVLKKEFIHVFRDKASLFMVLMMPVVFMMLFGYAVNTDVDNIPTAVLDMDKTEASRELILNFQNTGFFRMEIYADNMETLDQAFENNDINAGLIILPSYSRGLGNMDKVELIIDGTDPNTARSVLQYGNAIGLNTMMKGSGGTVEGMNTQVWYNPNMESRRFTIPGLIGLIMQNITVMLTAFSLVREKERGTIELLAIAPLKSSELIFGKMVPYIIIGFIDFIVAMGIGVLWFGVAVEGSLLLMVATGLGFVICSLSIGMLISTLADSQLAAMQMTIIIILPSVLLSGFVFPLEAMPIFIKMISRIIPLTYFLEISRSIMLKGAGIEGLYQEILSMAGLTALLLTVAIKRFKQIMQ